MFYTIRIITRVITTYPVSVDSILQQTDLQDNNTAINAVNQALQPVNQHSVIDKVIRPVFSSSGDNGASLFIPVYALQGDYYLWVYVGLVVEFNKTGPLIDRIFLIQ